MKTINEIGKLFTATFIIAISLLITLYTSYEIIIELGIIVLGAILALVMYILSSKYEKGLERELDTKEMQKKMLSAKITSHQSVIDEYEIKYEELEKICDTYKYQLDKKPKERNKLLKEFKGTELSTFGYFLKEQSYYEDLDECTFTFGISETDKEYKLTYKEAVEKYGYCATVVDYDIYHDINEAHNYVWTGWIEIEPCLPFSEDNDTTEQIYTCTQCNSSNVRETAHYVICNECGKRKKKTGYGTKLDKELR